jgi:hypothetical protein
MLHISYRRPFITKEDISKISSRNSACKLAYTNSAINQKSNIKVTIKESTCENNLRLFFVV